ncbi:MAG: thiamine pyrophosphate-binding protein [Chloroflexi bacterium]|nr:thiamine pyrophosphate-binding protein [Chloroflexota bacterium]
MSKITGGQLVVKALKQEGVNCVFALCGGHIDPIMQGCLNEKVRLVDARHEQAAVFMADGWARVTGQPGVALVTAGPGVTNTITSLWSASECFSPIIVFGGRSILSEFEMGSLQDMDTLTLVDSVTKWRRGVYQTRRIPEYVSMAFRQALSGRQGPVYLEIPWDILRGEVEEEEVPLPTGYRTKARAQGDPTMVKKAVDLLLSAKRPIAIAGSGVKWSGAGKELQELIELIKLPVTLGQMGRGAVPDDHPLCCGPTRVGTREADVVLIVGTRLNFQLAYGRSPLFAEEAKFIQIDIEPTEIGHNRPIDVGICGDAKAVLKQMIDEARDRCKGRKELPWVAECRDYLKGRREQLELNMNSDIMPMHPARMCKEISEFLDKDATIVMDGADITLWANTIFRANQPDHWFDNAPTGCLGLGTGFAIAAKIARPDKQVFLLNGDGAFGFNSMEFDTMVRHNIPVVCVVGNDGGWGQIKQGQVARGGKVFATELGYVRYDKMVEGLGGYGEFVEEPEDIKPALKRAFASGLPACINVKCAGVGGPSRRGRPELSKTAAKPADAKSR